MTVLIRSTSLIQGKVNEKTNAVYASRSMRRSVSTATTAAMSFQDDSFTSSQQTSSQQSSLLLGAEANLFAPQQELQGVIMMQKQLTDAELEELTDPQMPIRFYRASKGHVAAAVQQLRQCLAWRREFGVDALCHAFSTTINNNNNMAQVMTRENASGKIYVRGYDNQGRALVYMRPARENTDNEHEQMMHLVWNLKKAIACTRRESLQRSGKELEKVILLIDYEGFALTNAPPMSTTKATLHILQHMYPERMYRAYCLHPPMIFRAFWNMVRPFVDPVTKEKIVFVSSKSTQQQLWSLVHDKDKDLETGAGGKLSPSDFDSYTYLHLPFAEALPTTAK